MREPLAPVLGRRVDPLERLVECLRARVLGPAERDERGLALAQRRAAGQPRALEADVQVGGEASGRVGEPRRSRAPRGSPCPSYSQCAGLAPVVEARLALELELDHALRAARGAHERVVGLPVVRRAALAVGALGGVVPRARRSARRARRASRCAPSRSSRRPSTRAGSGARSAPARRPARSGSGPRRGRASTRRRSASRTAAGRATRRCRSARPARRPRSRTAARSPRSAGTRCARGMVSDRIGSAQASADARPPRAAVQAARAV